MNGSSIRLSVCGVGHRYDALPVLDGIDLVAEAGRVLVLIGPSGCGKSTLLGIMGGLIAPTAGTVRMEGHVAPDCLNPLTPVFQDFALLPWRGVAGTAYAAVIGLTAAGLLSDFTEAATAFPIPTRTFAPTARNGRDRRYARFREAAGDLYGRPPGGRATD